MNSEHPAASLGDRLSRLSRVRLIYRSFPSLFRRRVLFIKKFLVCKHSIACRVCMIYLKKSKILLLVTLHMQSFYSNWLSGMKIKFLLLCNTIKLKNFKQIMDRIWQKTVYYYSLWLKKNAGSLTNHETKG